jgi:endoglucanase
MTPRRLVVAAVVTLVAVAGCTVPSERSGPEVAVPDAELIAGDGVSSGTFSRVDDQVAFSWGGERLWVRWRHAEQCDTPVRVRVDGVDSQFELDEEWSSKVVAPSAETVVIDPQGCTVDVDHLSDTDRPFVGASVAKVRELPSGAPQPIRSTHAALWLTEASTAADTAAEGLALAAASGGGVPVFVVYMRPDRDCGGYSSHGATQDTEEYLAAVRDTAATLKGSEALVIVEPDATSLDCGDPSTIAAAVTLLSDTPGVAVYLDGGHPGWHPVGEQARRLRDAGVDRADGVSIGVANFVPVDELVVYGDELSERLGGIGYVADVSRSGARVPTGQWCNPPEARVGPEPSFDTPAVAMVAELWVKQPGESDGECNGGPAAGQWWPLGARRLVAGR